MSDVAGGRMIDMMLNPDARFIFPLDDDYWRPSVTVGDGLYEPEIDWLLRRTSDRPYAMLDCGANLGYWSVLASSAAYGSHAVVAIEASRANFQILCRNADANGNRFLALHRAVYDSSGRQVRLYGKRHYGMSLRRDWRPDENDRAEDVDTITLDDAADCYVPGRTHPMLLKIDVEGAEIEAIRGAGRLLDEGALVIYEDHGKEPDHRVSRFVLAQDGIAVWYVDADRQPRRITTLAQVAAIKTDPRNGYNFFACRWSSPWSHVFAG
jgi:FkbM family methyltransferase